MITKLTKSVVSDQTQTLNQLMPLPLWSAMPLANLVSGPSMVLLPCPWPHTRVRAGIGSSIWASYVSYTESRIWNWDDSSRMWLQTGCGSNFDHRIHRGIMKKHHIQAVLSAARRWTTWHSEDTTEAFPFSPLHHPVMNDHDLVTAMTTWRSPMI